MLTNVYRVELRCETRFSFSSQENVEVRKFEVQLNFNVQAFLFLTGSRSLRLRLTRTRVTSLTHVTHAQAYYR